MTRALLRARRGMTLMELVIGLAITGMMAAAGAGAFASIIDHRRVIRQASASTERATALREMIRSWVLGGNIFFQQGGGPRGLNTRAVQQSLRSSAGAGNFAAVSAAQAAGDEVSFTTSALNPSLRGNVRIRMFVDGDANTPEKGLTIEYQPNAQQPLVRRMLDSTIDTLIVELLDQRMNRWIRSSEAATATPRAVRLTLRSSLPQSPVLGVPMLYTITSATVVGRNINR